MNKAEKIITLTILDLIFTTGIFMYGIVETDNRTVSAVLCAASVICFLLCLLTTTVLFDAIEQ